MTLWALYLALPLVSHENTPLLWLALVWSSNLILMSRKKLQHCDSGQKIGIICKKIIFFSPSGLTPPTPGHGTTGRAPFSFPKDIIGARLVGYVVQAHDELCHIWMRYRSAVFSYLPGFHVAFSLIPDINVK